MTMQHRRQDAVDAYARRAPDARPPTWHPILAAVEPEPGTWELRDQYARCYGVVRLLRIGGEAGYRAVTWAPESRDRALIGYYRTLRAAAAAAHRRWLDGHAEAGGVNGVR